MDNSAWFRLIAGIFLLSAVSVSVYYRSAAQRASKERLDRSEENKALQGILRLGGLLLWLALILYLVNPAWLSWAYYPSPDWLRWLGVGVAGLSWLLVIWMFRSLGKNITDTVATRREHQLVTHGPYRWIRHPLYTFGTLFFLSLGLIAGSWLILLMACLAFYLLSLRTPKEESQLLAHFGEQYAAYVQRTGRYFPKISALFPGSPIGRVERSEQ